MIEEAIRSKLLSNATLAELVSGRIYILKLPQNPVYPAITFFKVTGQRHFDLDVAFPYFQFDSWAKTYSGAREIANLIRTTLIREKGIWGSVKIVNSVFINEFDLYENDTGIFHIVSEFKIIYKGE